MSKKPIEYLSCVKTSKGKKVKAHGIKKWWKNEKTKRPPKKKILNNEKGTTVI